MLSESDREICQRSMERLVGSAYYREKTTAPGATKFAVMMDDQEPSILVHCALDEEDGRWVHRAQVVEWNFFPNAAADDGKEPQEETTTGVLERQIEDDGDDGAELGCFVDSFAFLNAKEHDSSDTED